MQGQEGIRDLYPKIAMHILYLKGTGQQVSQVPNRVNIKSEFG